MLNISLCYAALKNFLKANEFLKKGFDACQPDCQESFMVEGLQAQGRIYFCKGNLDSAEVCYLKSYALAKKNGSRRYEMILLSDLATICLQRNQISLGLQYLSETESMMQGSPFMLESIDLYSKFSSLYKESR